MPRRPPFNSCPAQGYFLQPYERLPAGAPQHRLGGKLAEPVDCGTCELALRRLLRLDCRDPRLELPQLAGTHLDLLTCAVCAETRYTLTSRGEVLALNRPGSGAVPEWAPMPPPPATPVVLHAVPERILEARLLAIEGRLDEAADWARKFDWESPVQQVGGLPVVLSRHLTVPVCELCGSNMPFLASVVSSPSPRIDLTDEMPAQTLFFLCRTCPSVAALRDTAEID